MLQDDQHHLPNGTAANGGVKGTGAAAAAAAAPPPPPQPEPELAFDDTAPSLRQVCLELQDKVEAFLAADVDNKLLRGVQAQVKEAVGVIDDALERYSMEELALSYNGGKDCLVLLVLILACLPRHFDHEPAPSPSPSPSPSPNPASLAPSSSSSSSFAANGLSHSQPPPNTPLSATPRSNTPSVPFPTTLQSVYVVSRHPFAEVDAFVERSAATYHLDLCRYALPMRLALGAYLQERPRVKAVFVGTRRTDPHGAALAHFDPTDEGWPAFVRVHPVIDWHYAEIWTFIRHLEIPYLSLYDKGYTSLGGTEDTHPNPQLKKDDGAEGFRPAYELMADDEERLGRDQ